MAFQDVLKRALDAKGVTQVELANRMRIPAMQVSQWITGHRKNPRRDTINRIADALGISPDQLLKDDSAPWEPLLECAGEVLLPVMPDHAIRPDPLHSHPMPDAEGEHEEDDTRTHLWRIDLSRPSINLLLSAPRHHPAGLFQVFRLIHPRANLPRFQARPTRN